MADATSCVGDVSKNEKRIERLRAFFTALVVMLLLQLFLHLVSLPEENPIEQ
jgi:hypothetical protein